MVKRGHVSVNYLFRQAFTQVDDQIFVRLVLIFFVIFSLSVEIMSLSAPKLKFNNGEECPQFGLGTWLSDKGKVREAVEHAITKGYRLGVFFCYSFNFFPV